MATTTKTPKNPEVEKIERQLVAMTKQVAELARRIQYLERENSRRKSEVTQIAGHINKR